MTLVFVRRFFFAAVLALCITVRPAFAQFSKATILLSGRVTDVESGKPLRTRIAFIDQQGAEANKVLTNAEGRYQAVLKPGVSYRVNLVASQRYVASEPIAFEASETSQQTSHDFTLKPIHAGTVMFGDLCFDHGSVTPRDAAAQAIAAAGQAMKTNNEIEVSVETFSDESTDNAPVPLDQGSRRADAIKKILLANGAAANRVATNPHNPPPPPPQQVEQAAGKGKKKAKVKPKKLPAKKPARGKKAVVEAPQAVKATITIINVHSEDE